MNPGDLIRVKKVEWMDCGNGYLLHILSKEKNGGYGIIIISGPHLGREHVIYPHKREFEVISESR